MQALKWALKKELIPHPPSEKQITFLLLPDEDGFYGGAAGGGKSDALLMGALMFFYVTGYSAIIFRKTLQDHNLPDGLIPRSKQWLTGKCIWNGSTKTWTHPESGATLTFGYLDKPDDHYRYQSSAYQYIGFDEIPQFREYQVRYMFSRLRKLEVMGDIPLRVRGAGNPDGPYVHWVKERYVDLETAISEFVPAKIDDNPGLDKETYRRSLSHLPIVLRERLMNGDWEMRDVGSMFNRSWFRLTKTLPSNCYGVRYWDKAATEKKKGNDPAYTAGLLMARSPEGRFYVVDIRHLRGSPKTVEKVIKQTAILDRQRPEFRTIRVYLEQEPGSAGVDVIAYYRAVLEGFPFYPDKVTGSKADRAESFSSMAESGNVHIVVGNWDIRGYLDELEAFPEADKKDRVDASSGAFRMLTAHPPLGGGVVDKFTDRL